LACPYFMPTEKIDGGEWPHPTRLPLGSGWLGVCTAAETPVIPENDELRDYCNLGYARCSRLPADRQADAVRFAIAAASESRIVLSYVLERDHRPGESGRLEFSAETGTWIAAHSDARIQMMADCYVRAYRHRTSEFTRL